MSRGWPHTPLCAFLCATPPPRCYGIELISTQGLTITLVKVLIRYCYQDEIFRSNSQSLVVQPGCELWAGLADFMVRSDSLTRGSINFMCREQKMQDLGPAPSIFLPVTDGSLSLGSSL